jgi:hypothetical protein
VLSIKRRPPAQRKTPACNRICTDQCAQSTGVHSLGPGETITIPAGRRIFRQCTMAVTRRLWSGLPRRSKNHLRFFLNFATAARTHPECSDLTESQGARDGPALHTFKDHLYVAGSPVWLQSSVITSNRLRATVTAFAATLIFRHCSASSNGSAIWLSKRQSLRGDQYQAPAATHRPRAC